MRKDVHPHVIRQGGCSDKDFPGVTADLCKFGKTDFGRATHELIGHDVLKIVDDNDLDAFFSRFLHSADNAVPVIRYVDGQPCIAERKGLFNRLNQGQFSRFEISKTGAFPGS